MPVEAYCGLHGRVSDGLSSGMPLETAPRLGRRPVLNRRCPLPQYLKASLLTAAILIALCMRSDAQEALSAAGIENRIVGHAVQGRKGILSVSSRD